MARIYKLGIRKTWEFTNPMGERYLFGQVGTGRSSYVATLAYLGKEKKKVKEVV